jgi:hypothetical protein
MPLRRAISSGWDGLVVPRPGRDPRLAAREVRMPMKNSDAEMNGHALDCARRSP